MAYQEFTEQEIVDGIQEACLFQIRNGIGGFESPTELLLRNDIIPIIQKFISPVCSAVEMKKPGQIFVGSYSQPNRINCYIWTYEE